MKQQKQQLLWKVKEQKELDEQKEHTDFDLKEEKRLQRRTDLTNYAYELVALVYGTVVCYIIWAVV